MSGANAERVDVQAIRAAHPIEDVIASSGVELHPSGQGYMGCCPFHDDSTASMSVGGVPDRFKCFGCGAGGDVIEYVSKRYDLSFIGSIEALQNGDIGNSGHSPQPIARITSERDLPRITTDRGYDINRMAWEHFEAPMAAEFAQNYLVHRRGIDLGALRAFPGGAPVVGYAGTGWTTLVSHLLDKGVSDDELLATDLAQLTRSGRLVDAYRGRIIIPVRNNAGQINGFIGRDVTGDSRAPKYRNPTHTTTFNKSMILYRPTHHGLAADANVVIVEGVLDALAIAAVAARGGEMDRYAPCTTSGVTASHEQVSRVLALHPRPPVIALDGDGSGVEGTGRWLQGLCLDSGRPALVTALPRETDPAEWLAVQGDLGLSVFDRRGCLPTDERHVKPSLPGRALVRLLAQRHPQPVRAVLTSLVPLAARLPPAPAAHLLREAEGEVTRLGLRPERLLHPSTDRGCRPDRVGARASSDGRHLSTSLSVRPEHPQIRRTRFPLRRLKGDRAHVLATADSLTADLADPSGPHAPTASTGRASRRRPMNTTTPCPQLLGLAAEHLAAAAHHAEANAGGDLTSPWHSLAGQIRLIAGGVSPACDDDPVTQRPFGVQDHLAAALKVLDSIPPGLGPPDIVVWAWRVGDLRSLVGLWGNKP